MRKKHDEDEEFAERARNVVKLRKAVMNISASVAQLVDITHDAEPDHPTV